MAIAIPHCLKNIDTMGLVCTLHRPQKNTYYEVHWDSDTHSVKVWDCQDEYFLALEGIAVDAPKAYICASAILDELRR